MKKILTAFCMTLLLWAAVLLPATYAEDGDGGDIAQSDSARVASLYVNSYPTKTIYNSFERLDKEGLVLRARFEDGSERLLSHDEIVVSYQKDTCLRVGDTHAFLSYGSASVSVPVTVNRIEYDVTSLEIADFSVVYNGKFNSFETPFPDIVGLDGIPLKVKIRGGGENVGKYDVSIDFETSSNDYYTPGSRVVTMTVEPFCTSVVWENLSFIYDGKSKLPTAYFIDVYGNKIYPEAIGSQTAVGTSYTARVVFGDPNYKLSNTECRFDIRRADYSFEGVTWSHDSFVYDGSEKSISLSGLPAGVKVVSYVGDRATAAGKYTVTARLAWEEDNYNSPDSLTHTWEIAPASYDLSGFRFLPGEYVFDGKIHYPTLEGAMPVGADGIPLEYSFSEGACHVSDGTVSCSIIFSTKSKNYEIPEPIYSSVTVKPLGIEVSWGDVELTYSGEKQTPTATATECIIKVKGEALDVGEYTAEAYSENTDYTVLNPHKEFKIKKSENRWLTYPENAICYEGRTVSIDATPRFGEVQLVYFSDSEGKNTIPAPKSAGKYYARAEVLGTDNYSGIASEIFSFEVVKIVAVSIFASLSRDELCAFDTLTASDITCTVVNNDGSREEVDSRLVEVKYQNGTSLRKKDAYVTVGYDGFNYKIGVEVDYADYDMSGAIWCDTEPTYDGKPKFPRLSCLPEGVSVREYLGAGGVNAGKYTVTAVLDYDRENYNEPRLPSVTMTVKKATVDIPILSAAYNGGFIIPKSDSSIYEITSYGEMKNAGSYKIEVALLDKENYEFIGGTSVADGSFVITPRVITVSIEDKKLHLFESIGEVDYSIISGTPIEGDALVLTQYIEGRRAYILSENPNYTVVSTGGEIRRLPYPSIAFFAYFLLIVGALTGTGILVYFTLIKPGKIQNAVAILKCRFKNRRLSVYPPRQLKSQNIRVNYIDDFPDEIKDEADKVPDKNLSDPVHTETAESDEQEDDSSDNADNEDVSEDDLAVNDGLDSEIDSLGINAQHADTLITDSMAKNLIDRDGEIIYTDGEKKNVVNVDTLSENFTPGDRVDVNTLKGKNLVPYDTAYIKVLARGVINKPLSVYANDFSLAAVKMIALTGGKAIRAVTVRKREKK